MRGSFKVGFCPKNVSKVILLPEKNFTEASDHPPLTRSMTPTMKDERLLILNRNNHTNQNHTFSFPDTR